MRVPKRIEQLLRAMLSSRGQVELALRGAVFEWTRGGTSGSPNAEFPGELKQLVELIDQSPWKIDDQEFQRLRDAGYSEDQVFEISIAAAAGAGMRRLEAGFRAIESANEQQGESESARIGHEA